MTKYIAAADIKIGTKFLSHGKHPRACTVMEIYTVYDSQDQHVSTYYKAGHEFLGQVVTENELCAVTIQRGVARLDEAKAEYHELLAKKRLGKRQAARLDVLKRIMGDLYKSPVEKPKKPRRPRRWYAAQNSYASECSSGFGNTWHVIVFDSKKARDNFVDSDYRVNTHSITKKEVTSYIHNSPKPFSGQAYVIDSWHICYESGATDDASIGEVIVDYTDDFDKRERLY